MSLSVFSGSTFQCFYPFVQQNLPFRCDASWVNFETQEKVSGTIRDFLQKDEASNLNNRSLFYAERCFRDLHDDDSVKKFKDNSVKQLIDPATLSENLKDSLLRKTLNKLADVTNEMQKVIENIPYNGHQGLLISIKEHWVLVDLYALLVCKNDTTVSLHTDLIGHDIF